MIVILIRRPAPDAVFGIGNVGILLLSNRCIQAVPDHLVRHIQSKRCHQRIVCIQAKSRLRRLLNAHPDLLHRMHHFPVAVQLIPEQICHHNHLRTNQGNHLLQSPLIAFDYRVVCLRLSGPGGIAGDLRCDTGEKVGSGFVGKTFMSGGCQRMLQHSRCCGLSVGSRHHNDFHSGACHLQNIFRKYPCRLSGKCRAAASRHAKKPSCSLAGCNGQNSLKLIWFTHYQFPFVDFLSLPCTALVRIFSLEFRL